MASILGLCLSVLSISSLVLFLSFLLQLHACLSALSEVVKFRVQILKQNGWTIVLKGSWFVNMNLVFTSDPVNVHHILTKNFTNYPKGQLVKEVFEMLGDGVLNSDFDWWKSQRNSTHSLIKNNKGDRYLKHITQQKVDKGLFSVLDYFSELGLMVDMQYVFKRFTFDTYWQLVFGPDPKCLSVEFPEVLLYKAFDEIEEAMFYRSTVPESWWKLQKWLQIGKEKKYTRAWRTYDKFLYEFISLKQDKLNTTKTQMENEEELDLLTASMVAEEGNKSKTFLRDMALNLFAAGRDTVSAGLTWFFWLLATHPSVENKILEEIKAKIQIDNDHHQDSPGGRISFNIEEVNRLIYLHATLCETLRLYPPLPINQKTAVQAETLPSGHHVNQSAKILLRFYAMGRMEEIWDKDCQEFKPERWSSENGCIVHVPSYKFSTFGAGPRSCLGKDISLIQMKIVAASVIWNYYLQIAEGHPVSPSSSITLFMKHGLKVQIFRRHAHALQ